MRVVKESGVVLKGVKQAKVLRAMVRLGTFTRKQLAQESGEEVSFTNGVVGRKMELLRRVEQRYSGRPGAPEEVLALTPEGEEALLEELSPLYADLQKEWHSKVDLKAYVPAAMEFQVARELIDELEASVESPGNAERSSTAAAVERILRLLTSASDREGIPIKPNLAEDPLLFEEQLDDRQRVAKARTDFLKGKLCWLVSTYFDNSANDILGGEAFTLGSRYLSSAAKVLKEYGAEESAHSIDYWAMQHVWPSLTNFLASAQKARGTFEALLNNVDPAVLPGLHSNIAAVVRPDPSKVVEGLISIYDQLYKPPTEKVVGLLDLRPEAMTLAILQGTTPEIQCRVPMKDLGVEPDIEDPLGTRLEDMVGEVLKGVAFYESTTGGKSVEEILIVGEGEVTKGFAKLASNRLKATCRLLELPSFAYPAEFGLALKASQFQAFPARGEHAGQRFLQKIKP